jgi:hypothetical protein
MDRASAARDKHRAPAARRKPCDPKLQRILVRAMRAALRRSEVLLPRSEEDDRALYGALSFA